MPIIRKFHLVLPRPSFIRPNLDYRAVIFDQAFNNSFHQILESIHYSASMKIIGAIRGTPKEKLYQ